MGDGGKIGAEFFRKRKVCAVGAVVAVVGRPNVGKSTFFNRLTKSRKAMVDDIPGVTRDRIYAKVTHNDVAFTLIDTGGFSRNDPDEFVQQIHFQVREAIMEADCVVMLLDGRAGLSPFDRDMLDLLRPLDKPKFFVVNKVDSPRDEHLAADFAALGVERIHTLSAEHGYGVDHFLDRLVKALPAGQPVEEDEDVPRIAVVGRPNVGKSSLVNRILGFERMVVSAAPGTTRDSVDSIAQRGGRKYIFVDTAGIRRKSRTSEKLEVFSVVRALKSLERCDVALLLLDASEGVTDQDVRIAGYAEERGCAVIFIANKWDLVEKGKNAAERFEEKVRDAARFLSFAPFLTISAASGQRVSRIFPLIDEIYAQYTSRLGTGVLNRAMESAFTRHVPPLVHGRRMKFFYTTQVATRPPTFVAFVNYADSVHFSYSRYLINHIRKEASLTRTPVRLFFRQRDRRENKKK